MGQWKHRVLEVQDDKLNCQECGWVPFSIVTGRPKCSVGKREQRGERSEQQKEKRRLGTKKAQPGYKPWTPPHGLTPAEAKAMRDGGRCEICGTDADIVIDHNHETGKLRGLLCRKHNSGLGMFGDDVELFKAAIEYLVRGGS